MKILEIEINNIRGLKNLIISPNGENFAIWGPNGSGKSGVVDSLDFLLTGAISRLIGEGTSGISLAKHGPHIDHVNIPQSSYVKATIVVPGINGEITLRRCMATPGELLIEGADEDQLSEILYLASGEQQSLSRREILRYVAAQAGKRSQEVQALLKLEGLEAIRLTIQRITNQAKTGLKASMRSVADAFASVSSTLSLESYSHESTLEKVNELRVILGANLFLRLR